MHTNVVISDNFADRLRLLYGDGGVPKTPVVPGLVFRVPMDKLKAGLLDRAKYHAGRIATKEAELPKLRALTKGIEDVGSRLSAIQTDDIGLAGKMGGYSNASMPRGFNDNASQLEARITAIENEIRGHHNKKLSFEFLAECLYPLADYALTWEDLRTIEFVP